MVFSWKWKTRRTMVGRGRHSLDLCLAVSEIFFFSFLKRPKNLPLLKRTDLKYQNCWRGIILITVLFNGLFSGWNFIYLFYLFVCHYCGFSVSQFSWWKGIKGLGWWREICFLFEYCFFHFLTILKILKLIKLNLLSLLIIIFTILLIIF